MSRWLAVGLMLCFAGWLGPARAIEVTDDRGVVVHLPQPPRRIVTVYPSLAETVCTLGACDRLVGVDDYADWPASVRKLPHVGGIDVNIELVVSLRPDLVLLPATSRGIARLESLGVKVFGVDLKTMADVQRTLLNVGRLMDVSGAPAAWERIDRSIADAARRLDPELRGTTVYFEIGSGPYAASEASHIGDLLTRLGLRNVVPASLGSVPRLNPEFVVRADPQVIIIGASGARQLAQRPGWSRIRAVREGRVCALSPAQFDQVVRLGPRLTEAADIVVGCLRRQDKARP